MRAPGLKQRSGLTPGWRGTGLLAGLMALSCGLPPVHAGEVEPSRAKQIAEGRALFHREWLPHDERSHGGDGLGPAYNESSCVACHNAGGPGGSGPTDKNVDLLTFSRDVSPIFVSKAPLDLSPNEPPTQDEVGPALNAPFGQSQFPSPSQSKRVYADLIPQDPPIFPERESGPVSRFFDEMAHNAKDGKSLAELFEFHPGFRESRTVTLHRFGTTSTYTDWRKTRIQKLNKDQHMVIQRNTSDAPLFPEDGSWNPEAPAAKARNKIMGEVPEINPTHVVGEARIQVTRSQRNPTPLFGLGLIEAIPDTAITAEAQRQVDRTPATAGRVGRVKGGRIGRLGWKGQTASVADFVLDACAVEVGLEVPGHPQGELPTDARTKPDGLDLTQTECDSLVAFVESLPRPVERPATGQEAEMLARGKTRFAAIGCANCHTPDLGTVAGLYSDLLLHDVGATMAGSGSYGGSSGDDEINSGDIIERVMANRPVFPVFRDKVVGTNLGATRSEWRTPPLWGLRDSAPYLHDGRARTLEQAIALHAGQGEASSLRFFALGTDDRVELEGFLKSLVAPTAVPAEPVAMR